MTPRHETDALTPARVRSILAVAATGSFSVAARAVGTSQSNVSRSVAAVESLLGTVLFDRSTRTVRLTDQGREFVERMTLVSAELDAIVRTVREDQRVAPRLVVASLTSVSELYLADAIAALDPRAPRFRCVEGLQATVEHAVLSGQASLGIGDLSDTPSELATRALWNEPIRIAVPRGHRLARRRSVTLDDVAPEPLVGFSFDAELRSTVDRELAGARQLRAPDYVVDRYRTALAMVSNGLGVMVVPAIIAPGVPPGVRLLDVDHRGMSRTMGIMERSTDAPLRSVEPLLRRLVDSIATNVGVEVVG